jgi:long-chain acyl-CoA synthetase
MTDMRAEGPEPPRGTGSPWLKRYPKNISWDQQFERSSVVAFLDRAAASDGDRPCCWFQGRVTTYRAIADTADRIAGALQARGIGKDDRVGLLLPNSPTFICYYYAILKTGASVVNFSPLYTVDELAEQVRDSGIDAMVTLDLKVLFDKVEALLEKGPLRQAIVAPFSALLPPLKAILFRAARSRELARPRASAVAARIVLERDLLAVEHRFAPVPIDPENDIAVLQYTGGTTGTPKGAMLTHANLSVNARQSLAWAAELQGTHERMLAVLPFFHVFAMTTVLNAGIATASELYLMPRFVLDDALRLIETQKITVLAGVPTLFNALATHPEIAKHDLSSLRYCISGGAPLPVAVKASFEALTGCMLVEGYGLTEASPTVTCNPLAGPNKPGSVGLPLPATRISLRDLADPAREVEPGAKGEICVSGPQVMKGYWRRPEATIEQFTPDGWLKTGDVGVMDEDGFTFIVDRIKDLILSSGYNVYPRRIEEALYTHPAVEETTVIGIKDDRRGEAPKAFVKLKAGMVATEHELMAHLTGKLAKIELPVAIEFRSSLPKTIIGKLSKKELQAEEAQRTT